jgi:hypothetical protein
MFATLGIKYRSNLTNKNDSKMTEGEDMRNRIVVKMTANVEKNNRTDSIRQLWTKWPIQIICTVSKNKQQLNNYNYGFQLNEHSHIQVHCEEGIKIESTTIQGCTNMMDNTNHPPPHWLIKGTIIWRNEKKRKGKRKNWIFVENN